MNMLIGVLWQVVSAVAITEKETMMVTFVEERMRPLFDSIDIDGDRGISKDEFLGILTNDEAVRLLDEVGVNVLFLVDLCDTIFREKGAGDPLGPATKKLTFENLIEVILELR